MPNEPPLVDTIDQDTLTCEHCNATITEGEADTTENGDAGCGHCLSQCGDCDSTYHTDEMSALNTEGNLICCDCAVDYMACNECDTLHHIESLSYLNPRDEPICYSCAESYVICTNCECIIHVNDEQESMCPDCFSEHEANSCSELINAWNYKPDPIFFRLPDEDRKPNTIFYGLEIEADCGGHTDEAIENSDLCDNERYYCKEDSSIRNGFEIVSHPGTFNLWYDDESFSWARQIRKMGYRSYNTDTCGMHVHVSRSALSDSDIAKLLLFTKRNSVFIRFVSRRRYAAQMDEWANIDERPLKRLLPAIKVGGDAGDSRYTAWNLNNESTVECRVFRGTLSVPAIKRNVAFVASLVHFVKNAKHSQLTYLDYSRWLRQPSAVRELGKVAICSLLMWFSNFDHVSAGIEDAKKEEERKEEARLIRQREQEQAEIERTRLVRATERSDAELTYHEERIASWDRGERPDGFCGVPNCPECNPHVAIGV